MVINQFTGTFAALPQALALGLPTAYENSVWQVWLRGDGMYWITALERQEHDANAGYPITPEMLRHAFRPLSCADNTGPQLAAASTDLLQHWYTKKRVVCGSELCQISPPAGSAENGGGSAPPFLPTAEATEPAEQNGGENYFSPHVHFGYAHDNPDFSVPEAMASSCTMPDGTLLPPAGDPAAFSLPPTVEPPASSVPPVPLVPFAPHPLPAQPKPTTGAQSLAEGRMKVLEQAMRQEFTLLLEHLRDDKSPELLGEIEKLIQREAPYTWKQKYMFSEFGLALRREQQHHLALLCHQKALECSPRDENVLFNLARAEMELGNMARAKAHLHEALACAPHFTAAKNFLTFLSAR